MALMPNSAVPGFFALESVKDLRRGREDLLGWKHVRNSAGGIRVLARGGNHDLR
jgi:hypothetical protein